MSRIPKNLQDNVQGKDLDQLLNLNLQRKSQPLGTGFNLGVHLERIPGGDLQPLLLHLEASWIRNLQVGEDLVDLAIPVSAVLPRMSNRQCQSQDRVSGNVHQFPGIQHQVGFPGDHLLWLTPLTMSRMFNVLSPVEDHLVDSLGPERHLRQLPPLPVMLDLMELLEPGSKCKKYE